ncbi:MAG: hypothetical protein EPN84_05475 [Legionella sp.]|nr:MAG: hypothetical protein EPN84_05475 [Legionella sp.]
MTHNTTILSKWFVTDKNRAKAKIKYELDQLESQLNQFAKIYRNLKETPPQVTSLCELLAHHYLEYAKLINDKSTPAILDSTEAMDKLHWAHRLDKIATLRINLSQSTTDQESLIFLEQLVAQYQQFNTLATKQNSIKTWESQPLLNELDKLFHEENLQQWLEILVNFLNRHHTVPIDLGLLFQHWSLEQQQFVLKLFSDPKWMDLINAIFFYKLYPDQLFKEFIHPEKLVSLRARLGILHRFIEMLQQQLHHCAKQYGLKPGIDYLFHGDELPQGIMIEVDELSREIIQAAVKKVQIQFTSEDELQVTLERLHDLAYAYKFWFNPNRLIDAVMVLQQRLVKASLREPNALEIFQQEMVALYSHLTTTECLNLYGYFANNDSRYLLYTLYGIIQGSVLDWLPPLTEREKKTIHSVFQALQCVMEALRDCLKARHVNTEPYIYDLGKEVIKTGRRNQEAVFRIIAIYGDDGVTTSDHIEKLFSFVEEAT